jgi:glycine/D-amino acid oxidase-like deaminating enzyme
MEYLWREGLTHPRFPRLNGDAETDVLVIGGGMAGVLCAWCLHEAGAGYMLVEADRIGGGATLGTTAVLTAQHDTLYQDMIKKHGAETARLYLEANLEALSRIRDMCEKIPCDYVTTPSVMYSADDPGLMRREAEAVRSLGFPARFVKDAGLPFPAAGAVVYDGMAQFHPLKFLYGTAAG